MCVIVSPLFLLLGGAAGFCRAAAHFSVYGSFTAEGEFLELPELDLERLQTAWQEAVFAPTRSTGCPVGRGQDRAGSGRVENKRSWPHSGFSVDQSIYLPAGDRAGIERLIGTMTRCPFSLSRLVKVTQTGQVIYKPEKDACRAFPDPQRDELARGPQRNFQILDPLDFLAEFTQHIPPKGAHLIRGHRPKVGRGWYSNKARGMRRKAAEAAAAAAVEPVAASSSGDAGPAPARSRASQTWAMLIKRLYEIDPLACPELACPELACPELACPECGGQMKVVAFVEPPQADVIEKILRHCGLWCPSSPRAPPGEDGSVHDATSSDEPRERTFVDEAFVDEATFGATC